MVREDRKNYSEGFRRARRLVLPLDHIQWDSRGIDEIATCISCERPLWIRIANFFERTLELLRVLEHQQLILWKVEFWGTHTPFGNVPSSADVDPASYAKKLFSIGHQVVPYTFNEWNRARLSALVPMFMRHRLEVLPVAQKAPVPSEGRAEVRNRFRLGSTTPLLGAGGLLHPAKGIEEIVRGFLHTYPDLRAHLLCSLVVEDEKDTAETVRQRWSSAFGEAGMDRVHIRTGVYGEWSWMCAFYGALDLMLINSISDSWGRMVAESLGFCIPTLISPPCRLRDQLHRPWDRSRRRLQRHGCARLRRGDRKGSRPCSSASRLCRRAVFTPSRSAVVVEPITCAHSS